MTLKEVNLLDEDAFTERLGGIFEESPWIARQTWENRPFESRDDLLCKLKATVLESDRTAQVELIQAHPDLAGRLAEAGELTAESTREQKEAGLADADSEIRKNLQERNQRYREKFGFPFVICARLNNIKTILAAFDKRLESDRET